MNDNEWDVLDPPRSKLRSLVAQLEQLIGGLDATGGSEAGRAQIALVGEAWRELSKNLALGEEPVLRSCPHCQRRIPTEASRCRYCMASSAAVGGA